MRSLRSRYFLPMLMIPLFFVALFQAELRYRTCSANGGVCFDYPLYLNYETRQALDLHWPALLPAAMLGQLPDIIYSGPRNSSKWHPYVIVTFSVVIYWCLIGLWWERLLSGCRWAPRKTLRIFILFLVAVVFALVAASIYFGIRGGYEGATISDAAVISPLLLAVMALAECNVLPLFFRGIRGQVAIPVMLLGLFIWTDTAARNERLQHEIKAPAASSESTTVRFDFTIIPSPLLADGLMLNLPPLILSSLIEFALPSLFKSNSLPAITLSYFCVGLYWITLVSLMQGNFPATTSLYLSIRPLLVVVCFGILAISLISWILATGAHGPSPTLSIAVGQIALIYALQVNRIPKTDVLYA